MPSNQDCERPASAAPTNIPRNRPNYNILHSQLLPLKIYPLPPLILHNPFSVVYFACTFFYQFLFPPLSHPKSKLQALFSIETRSIHVTDQHAIRTLWDSGFFGKGSLSRSEPNWLDREMRRQGIIVGETSEELTRRRREERREFKKERALKEREAIEEALQEERRPDISDHVNLATEVNRVTKEAFKAVSEVKDDGDLITSSTTTIPAQVNIEILLDKQPTMLESVHLTTKVPASKEGPIENQEHLQLTLEEAFFLAYGLGVLEVLRPASSLPIPVDALFTMFRENSYFPPVSSPDLRADDPFLVSYVVYHHFRSLGWVVRSGVKFSVDYLLYNRGPVFSHAEFAIIILPSYRHPYWHENAERHANTIKRESKNWWWLHCVNRVQSQVRKSLVLAYIEIPPPLQEEPSEVFEKKHQEVDVSELLKRYTIRELIVRRWIPNRSRD